MKKRVVNRSIRKLLCAMLSSVMLLVSIPMTVVGEGLSIGQIGANDNAQLVGTADTFYEDVSMRDEFSKHYVLESGERYAVIFPEAVHYEEDGEWKEVDNRLTYNSLTGKYVSANPKFTTTFAANASATELVSITSGEYTVSWGISFSENSGGELMKLSAGASVTNGNDTAERLAAAKAEQASLAKASAETNQAFDTENAENIYKNTVTDIGKAASSISYGGSTNSAVSLRYSVAHGKVEEDIILKSKSDFSSCTMTVNTGGLTVTAETDGSVIFKTADGETVFTIDAPWMKDSAYGFSKDIAVTVTQTGNTATVTYTPSAEWLNSEDRVYPVLIDPTITTNTYSPGIIDTYVLDGDWDFNYYDGDQSLLAGMSPVGQWYSFIKLQTFPSINEEVYTITSGELILCSPADSDNYLSLHQATSNWVGEDVNSPPSTITCDEDVVATYENGIYKYVFSLNYYFSCINRDYGEDYEYYWANHNHGFMIMSSYSSTDDVTTMYSSNTQSINYRPMATFTYETGTVVEDVIDDWFIEGGIYNIKSVRVGTYVTVQNSSYSIGTNVYQSELSTLPSTEQSYYFVYCGNDKYKIKPINGGSMVLGFDYESALVEGYANVNLYDETIAHIENREDYIFWRIEYIDNEYVRISSYANPELVLTADNSYSNTSALTTHGNIIIREFASAVSDDQTWQILSGGKSIYQASDIRKITDVTLNVGDSLQLNAARTDMSSSITWSSSNNDVATISADGFISAVGVGTARISASEALSGGEPVEHSISLTVALFDSKECFIKDIAGENALYYNLLETGCVEMSNWSSSENLLWTLTYYDGYYTIKYSNLGYLTVPVTLSAGAEVSLTNIMYADPLYTQLWKITPLGDGTYKIQSKYHENEGSDLVLAQGDYGTVMLQNYTGDSNYNDVWDVMVLKTLNIEVYADAAYRTRHSNYSSRILTHMEKVKEIFLDEFNIVVQYTSVIDIYSYADQCGNYGTQGCAHADDDQCENSDITSPSTAKQYHHKNIYNIVVRLGLPDISTNTKLVFLGHKTCTEDDHTTNVFGRSWSAFGISVITNFDNGTASECKTTLHELLHWYGAPDHYDDVDDDDNIYTTEEINKKYNTNNFVDDCIFGYNKENDTVKQNLLICEGCKSIIRQNLNNFDH